MNADETGRLAAARATLVSATLKFDEAKAAVAKEELVLDALRKTAEPTAASGATWVAARAQLYRDRDACDERLRNLRAAYAEASAKLEAAKVAVAKLENLP